MEKQTSRIVRALWAAAGRKRTDPDFLRLLVLFTWTKVGNDESGYESTLRWRNHYLADYLGIGDVSPAQLADALGRAFPQAAEPA